MLPGMVSPDLDALLIYVQIWNMASAMAAAFLRDNYYDFDPEHAEWVEERGIVLLIPGERTKERERAPLPVAEKKSCAAKSAWYRDARRLLSRREA